MAANFACASKAMFLLVLCFAVAFTTVNAGAQHACPYPQACTTPGAPDPHHTVTATARFDPTTGQCVTIPSVTGPHDCQQFATLAACQTTCESAD